MATFLRKGFLSHGMVEEMRVNTSVHALTFSVLLSVVVSRCFRILLP